MQSDASSWTAAVDTVTNSDDLDHIRSTFDAFLTEYPLAYGYWNRYSTIVFEKTGNVQDAVEIYERAVQAVRPSVDIWVYYATWFAEKSEDLDAIRKVFERGVEAVGTDYRAHELWDKYIEFEKSQDEKVNALKVLSRVVQTPIAELDRFWEQYCKEEKDGFDEPEGINEAYGKAKEELMKRDGFEKEIRQFYFHKNPVSEVEVENWRNYLRFEENEGDENAVIRLYERCLVACCYREEFWFKYTKYLESKGQTDLVRHALQRAARTFLKDRPRAHIDLALFEECQGNVEEAKNVFEALVKTFCPLHVESVLEFTSFLRRTEGNEKAVEYLGEEMGNFYSASKVKEYIFITPEFCRLSSPEKARKCLDGCIQMYPDNKFVVLAYANWELSQKEEDSSVVERVSAIFERGIEAEQMSATTKIQLLQHYIDFLSAHDPKADRLRKARSQLSELKIVPRSGVEQLSRKRPLQSGAEDGVAPPAKIAHSDAGAQQWQAYYGAGGSYPGGPAV
eukprot:TRINITY_DN1433_c0_g1_i1.p1 TRINITY_DN1433_c0_g1~~TRINITY_DN1433_c0_g1_i1.p1  ORF type:complete len:508 (-),score=128.53 TRINITY_DN1433_c0_g1_i1:214-1737(-)